MKYIKAYEYTEYETNRKKYKVGDYVLMSGQLLKSGKDQPIKIIEILHFPESGSYVHMYKNGETSVSEYKDIIRYLTPEEIEQFEMNLSLNKYNL